jgi:TatA/E family protein of Tat protein translocase
MLEDLLSWDKLLLIAVVLIVFFGPKRIPDIAQSIGKGIREFKKSIKDVQDEVSKPVNSEPTGEPKEIQEPAMSREAKTDPGTKTGPNS